MKRTFSLLAGLLISIAGCTAHHYKINAGVAHFYLKAPGANIVHFASSIDGYQIQPAKKIEDGTWVVAIPCDQEIRYFYVIDGKTFVPSCRTREKDDFGSENCIFSPSM